MYTVALTAHQAWGLDNLVSEDAEADESNIGRAFLLKVGSLLIELADSATAKGEMNLTEPELWMLRELISPVKAHGWRSLKLQVYRLLLQAQGDKVLERLGV